MLGACGRHSRDAGRLLLGCLRTEAAALIGKGASCTGGITCSASSTITRSACSEAAAGMLSRAAQLSRTHQLPHQFLLTSNFSSATAKISENVSYGFAVRTLPVARIAARCARQPIGLLTSLPVRAGRRLKATAAFGAEAGEATQRIQPPLSGAAALTAGLSDSMRRQLAAWLGLCSAWVFSMVVLGGVTRLTRSGLSMTDWKFTGETPPRNEAEWEAEFSRYKSSPEYQRVNRGMALDEFKFIYWMEYAHRAWGRALGLVFALPAAYFVARGAVNAPLGRRLGLLFALGGGQGLVGWWMVKSGLEAPASEFDVPRVSPYRLAAHLMSAFTIYALLLWTTLSVALPTPLLAAAPVSVVQGAAALRRFVLPAGGLIALTAASGAFVAGLDAGHAYNTFPKMGGQWVPPEYWAIPGIRNFFENTAAVQFDHRLLAASTLAATAGLWAVGARLPLPGPSRVLLHALVGVAATQVGLGIATLLSYVPVTLGSAHQAGALTLFSVALGLLYTLRPSPHVAPFGALARFLGPAAFAGAALAGASAVIVPPMA